MRINVKRVREEMARKRKTNISLCADAGITCSGFCKLMRSGSCRAETAGRIADALEIDPAELIL